MPKPYPPEFRRRALDLVSSGRTVRDVAAALGIAESCLYGLKSRDLIDRGLKPGTTTSESAELAAAQRRIRELEDEVKILRKAAAAVQKVMPPKERFQLVAELVADGVDAKRACRELAVSRSGYYEWRTRAPSARAIRHVWLSDRITAIHDASHGTYGSRRVQAELVHGQGVTVGHNTVALLMRRARPIRPAATAQVEASAGHLDDHQPGASQVRANRAESALGHRHHRAPNPLDSSSRRNTYWRCS